ncbi:hypothetical protein D3C83_222650 [compost metagenome]
MDLVGQSAALILVGRHQLLDQVVERALAVRDLAIEAGAFERCGRLERDAAQDLQRGFVGRLAPAD